MSNTKRISIRFPPPIHDRLMDHRDATTINTNAFVVMACFEKLNRDGYPVEMPRRKRRSIKSA